MQKNVSTFRPKGFEKFFVLTLRWICNKIIENILKLRKVSFRVSPIWVTLISRKMVEPTYIVYIRSCSRLIENLKTPSNSAYKSAFLFYYKVFCNKIQKKYMRIHKMAALDYMRRVLCKDKVVKNLNHHWVKHENLCIFHTKHCNHFQFVSFFAAVRQIERTIIPQTLVWDD